jgi:hypothetical protein
MKLQMSMMGRFFNRLYRVPCASLHSDRSVYLAYRYREINQGTLISSDEKRVPTFGPYAKLMDTISILQYSRKCEQ